MELAIEVDLVSLGLEIVIDLVEKLDLKHEVAHVIHRSLQVTNRLLKPVKDEVGAVEGDLGDELLHLILELLRCGSQISLDLF